MKQNALFTGTQPVKAFTRDAYNHKIKVGDSIVYIHETIQNCFVHPMNGYEIQCLTKTVKLSETELPKGRLIGITQYGVLDGRNEIMTYIRDNFRGFSSVTVYKVPDNIEID